MNAPLLKPAADFVLEHRGLINAVALKTARNHGRTDFREDLVSAGIQGVLIARQRFEGDDAVPFKVYAIQQAKFAMIDALRSDCLVRTYEARGKTHVVYREATGSVTVEALTPSDTDEPEAALLTKERNRLLLDALDTLTERERFVIRAVYWFGDTLETAADALGVDKSCACRIRARALTKLRSALEGDE